MTKYEFESMAKTGRRVGISDTLPGCFNISVKGLKIDSGQVVVVTLGQEDAIPFAKAVLETAGIDAEIVTDIPKVTRYDNDVFSFSDEETLVMDLPSPEEANQDVCHAVAVARYVRNRPDPQVERLARVLKEVDQDGTALDKYMSLAEKLIEAGVRVDD